MTAKEAMRAVVYRRFGPPDVLQMQEVPIPVPRPRQVRIRVFATTVTQAESNMRQGRPLWGRLLIGLTGPRKKFRTLGTEFAGEIDAVGDEVTRFRPGDRVFGFAGFHIGANADYFCLPEDASVAPLPPGVSFTRAAAAVDGPTTALFFLRDKAKLQPGQHVLVVGASGSVGSFAVQLAHRMGAHVTGVCSGKNVDLVRRLGADAVIDYTAERLGARDERYDIVFDAVGKSSFSACRPVMRERALYLDPTFMVESLWRAMVQGPWAQQRVVLGMSVEKRDALVEVGELLAKGELEVCIEETYPLEQLADAHRHVDTGHKVGNVAVLLDEAAASSWARTTEEQERAPAGPPVHGARAHRHEGEAGAWPGRETDLKAKRRLG